MNADTVKRLGFDVIAPLVKEIAEKSGLKRNEPNNSFLDGCYECEWTLPIIPKDRMGTFIVFVRAQQDGDGICVRFSWSHGYDGMFERNQTDDRPPLEKTFSLPLDETAIKVRGECQLNEIVREYRERFGTAD